MPAFVWMRSLRGPSPQAIVQELRDGKGKVVRSEDILQVTVVTEHEALLSLGALSILYPYRGGSNEES